VYRIVPTATPSPDAFKSHFELGKAKPNSCAGRALSVFRTKKQAAVCQAILQYLGDHVAVGDLTAAHGMTRLSEKKHPGHTSWWPHDGVDPRAVLSAIEGLL
jgi:hypothetical protein